MFQLRPDYLHFEIRIEFIVMSARLCKQISEFEVMRLAAERMAILLT